MLVENTQIQDEEKPSETVPEKLSIQQGVVYYIGDHLDSAHMMVDSRGNVLREESRYPYGLDKRIDSEVEVTADYVYTGKEYDDTTGLMYFGKRYYSPEMARWISPDPLFLERPEMLVEKSLESNLYAYVQNNPTNNIDVKGDYAVAVAVIAGLTVLAVKGAQYLSEYVNDQPIGTNSKEVNTALAVGVAVPVATVGTAALAVSAPAIAGAVGEAGLSLSYKAYTAQTTLTTTVANELEYMANFGKEIVNSAVSTYMSNPAFYNEVGGAAASGATQGLSDTTFPPQGYSNLISAPLEISTQIVVDRFQLEFDRR